MRKLLMLLGLSILVLIGVYFVLLLFDIFISDSIRNQKTHAYFSEQLKDINDVKVNEKMYFGSINVWTFDIEKKGRVYVEAYPSLLSDKVTLNVNKLLDQKASKECLSRRNTFPVSINENSGLKFDSLKDVINNFDQIREKAQSGEITNNSSSQSIKFDYNCQIVTITK